MRGFFRDTRGSASLWAAFIVIMLCMLSVVAYTGATLYSAYRTAQTDLERAANISVDMNMENRNVRDLILDIPQEPVLSSLENNLGLSGWTKDASGTWERVHGERLVYELRDLSAVVHDGLLDVTAVFTMPLPWAVGSLTDVEIPIAVRCKVLYLD